MISLSHSLPAGSPNRAGTAEVERLDAHFLSVLRSLESRQPRRLTRVQRRARSLHLERLERYRRRASFPKNLRFPGRMLPHFVDDHGTRCAMGYLIEESGERDLVARVARERNYARIRELADVPELVLWLEANGLTAEEAQKIQPEYCGTPARDCLCNQAAGSGYLEGTLGDGGSVLTVTAVYGAVHGVAPGDVLALMDTRGVGTSFDAVFANLGGDGKTAFLEFGANGGTVTLPPSACSFAYPQGPAIPGSLPLATVEKALAANGEIACQNVLAGYDARWGVVGGAGCATDSGGTPSGGAPDAGALSRSGSAQASPEAEDGGCAATPHPVHASAVGLAISAALVIRVVRRADRRR